MVLGTVSRPLLQFPAHESCVSHGVVRASLREKTTELLTLYLCHLEMIKPLGAADDLSSA